MKVIILAMIAFVACSLLYGVMSTEIAALEKRIESDAEIITRLKGRLIERERVVQTKTRLAYLWPIHLDDWKENGLSSPYGERDDSEAGGLSDGFHEGLDLWGISDSATWQARVIAVTDGWVEHWLKDEVKGRYILLHHDDGNESQYHHLSKSYIRDGDRVEQGQVIGRIGNTGLSTGAHLHFELHLDGREVNPLKYIDLP